MPTPEPSETSKRLWEEALASLNSDQLLEFFKKLVLLREEVLYQLINARRDVRGNDFIDYYMKIYTHFGLREDNTASKLSDAHYQQYYRLAYAFKEAYAAKEPLFSNDEMPTKEVPDFTKCYIAHQASAFFLPLHSDSTLTTKIHPTWQERWITNQFIEELPPIQPNVLSEELIHRLQHELDTLIQRFVREEQRAWFESSRESMVKKRKLLNGLRDDIHQEHENATLRANRLNQKLTDAIGNTTLNERRRWYDVFHMTPHTVKQLKRIRETLHKDQAELLNRREGLDAHSGRMFMFRTDVRKRRETEASTPRGKFIRRKSDPGPPGS